MTKFIKRVVDLKDAVSLFGIDIPSYITQDSSVSKRNGAQYEIIREVIHDGTLLFEVDLIKTALNPLIYKTSYFKSLDTNNVSDVRYIIGDIRLCTVFGYVNINGKKFIGEKQRIIIPVICEFSYN